jgi:hypothetical protein
MKNLEKIFIALVPPKNARDYLSQDCRAGLLSFPLNIAKHKGVILTVKAIKAKRCSTS